jgi:hypothetical protein
MKYKLKSRNVENLQRFAAFSRKSENIRAHFITISENWGKFEKIATYLLFSPENANSLGDSLLKICDWRVAK